MNRANYHYILGGLVRNSGFLSTRVGVGSRSPMPSHVYRPKLGLLLTALIGQVVQSHLSVGLSVPLYPLYLRNRLTVDLARK